MEIFSHFILQASQQALCAPRGYHLPPSSPLQTAAIGNVHMAFLMSGVGISAMDWFSSENPTP